MTCPTKGEHDAHAGPLSAPSPQSWGRQSAAPLPPIPLAPEVLDVVAHVRVGDTMLVCRLHDADAGTWIVDLSTSSVHVDTSRLSGLLRARRHRDRRACVEAAGMLASQLDLFRRRAERLRADVQASCEAYALESRS